jgi:hypothetical protein
VIAAPARDDLFLLRAAEDIVVVPNQLDVGLVGIRSGLAEVDFGHVIRRAIEDHFRERDRGFCAVAHVGMVIGKLAGLGGNGVGNFGAAIANIDAIEPGKSIEKVVPVAVFNMAALAGFDDPSWGFAAGVLGEMGRWVKEILAIPLIELVIFQHAFGPFACGYGSCIGGKAAPFQPCDKKQLRLEELHS